MLGLEDVDVNGKRVFVRLDVDVPVDDKVVTDDRRLRASLDTIRYLLDRGAARVVLAGHRGRPDGVCDDSYSMRPVARRLSELLSVDAVLYDALENLNNLSGQMILLENLRYVPGVEQNDDDFSRALASCCDVYVNDAFATLHRAHASTSGMVRYVGVAVVGFHVAHELSVLNALLDNPQRPLVAILGGAMAFTLLAAQGRSVGGARVDLAFVLAARELLASYGDKLVLPSDHVVAASVHDVVNVVVDIPDGMIPYDIGPSTIDTFRSVVRSAHTVVWNGPLGYCEVAPFDRGTLMLAHVVIESGALSIIGGGDTAASLKEYRDEFSFVSTGGGATLSYLAGVLLPGLVALENHAQFS